MEQEKDNQLQNIEISGMIEDGGHIQNIPDLFIFNSSNHNIDFLYRLPFRSKHFSVIIIHKGSLDVKINLFEYHLEVSDVIIIPPSAIREMSWEGQEVGFVSLLFTTDYLQQAGVMGKYIHIATFLKEGLRSYRKMDENDYNIIIELLSIAHRLLNSQKNKETQKEIINNIFRAVLLKVKDYYDEMATDELLTGTTVYKFIQLLSEYYTTEREVLFYAQKLFVNEKYLTQLLKKKTGRTARQFIIDMVILEGKVLLNNRALSVKEIAEKLHFENQFHFSRFFKKYVGIAPMLYRKSAK